MAAAARAQAIARMPPDRRLATLLAFARAFEAIALDDALDVLDLLITDIAPSPDRTGEQERLRTLRDLDAAALQLREAFRCSSTSVWRMPSPLDNLHPDPTQPLRRGGARVESLARPPDDDYYPELMEHYRCVRRF